MRYEKVSDVPLPPSGEELKEAGFTLRERVGLRILDIAGVFLEKNPIYGEPWPSQAELNQKTANNEQTTS